MSWVWLSCTLIHIADLWYYLRNVHSILVPYFVSHITCVTILQKYIFGTAWGYKWWFRFSIFPSFFPKIYGLCGHYTVYSISDEFNLQDLILTLYKHIKRVIFSCIILTVHWISQSLLQCTVPAFMWITLSMDIQFLSR